MESEYVILFQKYSKKFIREIRKNSKKYEFQFTPDALSEYYVMGKTIMENDSLILIKKELLPADDTIGYLGGEYYDEKYFNLR